MYICVYIYIHIYLYVYIYIYIYVYIYITFSLSVHLLMGISIASMSWLVNNAAVNTGVCVSFELAFCCFEYISRKRIAGLYGSFTFILWETSILFSIVAESIYIPTNSVQMFPFLHILTNTCYLCSL